MMPLYIGKSFMYEGSLFFSDASIWIHGNLCFQAPRIPATLYSRKFIKYFRPVCEGVVDVWREESWQEEDPCV